MARTDMAELSWQQPTALHQALGRRVLRRSFFVAIVVGTALNLINQGDALLVGATLSIPKLALTYAVPFLVSAYGAWSMAKLMQRKT